MKSNRLYIATILLTVLCLLASCRKACYVHVEQPLNGIPVFHLKENERATEEGVEITMAQVAHRVTQGKLSEEVWLIATGDFPARSKPVLINSITYGIVPPGFKEARKMLPLIVGETYEISVGKPGMACGALFVYKRKSEETSEPAINK